MGILALIQLGQRRIFTFVQKDIRSVYKDVFQEAVDKYNEKQNGMTVRLRITMTKYIKMIKRMSNENWS